MLPSGLRAALTFLTILPVRPPNDKTPPGYAFAWFPCVGLIIGLLLRATALLPLNADVVALFTLTLWILVTGGLHLDGYADSADGLLATTTPERRLTIMKDPRTGSWAVVGLVVLLLGKWVLLRDASPILLVLPPILGRWAMVLAMYRFPDARTDGLSVYFRDGFGSAQVIAATGFTLLCVVVMGGAIGVWLTLAAALVAAGGGAWAARRLGGGLTGDVYGLLCELTELACLFLIVILE